MVRSAIPAMLTLFLLLAATISFAQKQIRGVVKDAKGTAVASVTVTVKGTQVSTATGVDGVFHIMAKEGDVLELSAISFEKTEVRVSSSADYSLVLAASALMLGDVVVVGYGKASRKNLSSAVSTKA